MRLALLGIDADTLDLARAATASGQHQVVYALEADAAVEEVRRVAPLAKITGPWEFLMGTTSVDAVIMARGDEELRGEQLRKLVQDGVKLLVVHPAVESMLVYYELEMIRQENRSVLVPCLPARTHPAVASLAELITAGPTGPIGGAQQIVVERSMAQRSRRDVLAQFARDCDLLRVLCGELTKVGAMASQAEAESYANLGVQLSGPSGLLARWTVEPVEPALAADRSAGGRLTLVGASGKAILDMPCRGEWILETIASGRTQHQEFSDWNAAEVGLAQFAQAVAGVEVSPNWADAARTVELAEAVGRSLTKGRTIELHNEEYTEQGTFKGIMTSFGCGLLLVALAVIVVTVILGQIFKLPYVPHVVAAVLGLFLLAQLLRLVFPRE